MKKYVKKLPKELRTITPLSRLVAAGVFIAMPFIGFIVGMSYQQYLHTLGL